MSNSVRPQRRQPTRLPCPWDSPGKNTGVGCHFLLQCMKVKSESEVTQSCPTLSDPMDCSAPGSSVHGIFQARVLERHAIAFSDQMVPIIILHRNSIWAKYILNSTTLWNIQENVTIHFGWYYWNWEQTKIYLAELFVLLLHFNSPVATISFICSVSVFANYCLHRILTYGFQLLFQGEN